MGKTAETFKHAAGPASDAGWVTETMTKLAPWRGGWVEYGDRSSDSFAGDLVVVLVHGLGGSRRHFDSLVEGWTVSRVLIIDLPGFGGSQPSEGHLCVDDLALAIAAVLDHAGVQSALLAGHSMGGPIGVRWATLDPSRARCVVLLAGTVQSFTATLGWRLRPWLRTPMTAFVTVVELLSVCVAVPRPLVTLLSRSKIGRSLILWPFVQRPTRLTPAHAEALLAGAGAKGVLPTARALGRLGEWDTDDQASGCPLYAINGRADHIAPLADLDAFRLPLVARHVLESGHMLMIERPDELRVLLETIHAETGVEA